jgi:hypothetical protein
MYSLRELMWEVIMQANISNASDNTANNIANNTAKSIPIKAAVEVDFEQPLTLTLTPPLTSARLESPDRFAPIGVSVLKLGSYKQAIATLKDMLKVTDAYSASVKHKYLITYIRKAKALSSIRRSHLLAKISA